MIDTLIAAVAEKMLKKWGDKYSVYTESVYQGAEKPCFFVECEKAETVPLLQGKFFVRVTVKVTEENDSDTKKYEAEKNLGDMFNLLKKVDVNGCNLNGRKINSNWTNGKMVVRASFDLWGCEVTEENFDMMETVEIKEIF